MKGNERLKMGDKYASLSYRYHYLGRKPRIAPKKNVMSFLKSIFCSSKTTSIIREAISSTSSQVKVISTETTNRSPGISSAQAA